MGGHVKFWYGLKTERERREKRYITKRKKWERIEWGKVRGEEGKGVINMYSLVMIYAVLTLPQ